METGKVIAGRYRLERPLARGGMGSVWVAKHLHLDTDVAIKFVASHLAASAEVRARFEREAKAAALLKMANAVQVYDFGVEDGTPYMVMELLEGEDLEARLQREGRLSPAVVLGVLEQVCRVVRRAHEVGLVHRDLKPGNVFLARQGGEEIVKVLDFGIAKDTGAALGGGATRTGSLLGSPHYMSPEQVRSTNKVDHRTDLWALGVIAFRCLTGRLPFSGEEAGEVLVDVCTAPIPIPSQIVPGLGPAVDTFFARALERDPQRRFQRADELLQAFATLVTGVARPVFASSPGTFGTGSSAIVTGGSGTHPGGTGTVVGAPVSPAGQAPPTMLMTGPTAPVIGTLSPSSQTSFEPRPASRGRGIAIAVAVLALAVGMGVALFLRSSAPGAADAASAPPSATSTAAKPGVTEPSPSIAPTVAPSASAGEAPTSMSAAASASASTSASSPPPVKSAPGRTPPRKKADDPLNHM